MVWKIGTNSQVTRLQRAHTLQVTNMTPNTESAYETKCWDIRVVLIKHKLALPDDGPCGPKHVGVILMYSLF
jgi:hypothetical protein